MSVFWQTDSLRHEPKETRRVPQSPERSLTEQGTGFGHDTMNDMKIRVPLRDMKMSRNWPNGESRRKNETPHGLHQSGEAGEVRGWMPSILEMLLHRPVSYLLCVCIELRLGESEMQQQ